MERKKVSGTHRRVKKHEENFSQQMRVQKTQEPSLLKAQMVGETEKIKLKGGGQPPAPRTASTGRATSREE